MDKRSGLSRNAHLGLSYPERWEKPWLELDGRFIENLKCLDFKNVGKNPTELHRSSDQLSIGLRFAHSKMSSKIISFHMLLLSAGSFLSVLAGTSATTFSLSNLHGFWRFRDRFEYPTLGSKWKMNLCDWEREIANRWPGPIGGFKYWSTPLNPSANVSQIRT
jgi:hypothetical protein